MKPLLTRVVLLFILLGVYGWLHPAGVEGQSPTGRTCWTCGSWYGWARCYTVHDPGGWDYCRVETQDPIDPAWSYCVLGWRCTWWAV